MRARRTALNLFYNGTDISRDIAADLESFEWTDNESDKADDITVTLRNDHGRWHNEWYPGKGDTLQATIIDDRDGVIQTVYCGRFVIDDLVYKGPPDTFEIKAASVPLDQSIRRERRNRAWEDVLLSEVVSRIAQRGSLEPLYDVIRDHRYQRIDQRQESDLAFLQRICGDCGYSLKITDNQLVVFEQAEYENRDPIATIIRGSDEVLDYSFESQAYDLYSECTCSYTDPLTETLIERTVTAPNVIGGMTTRIVQRAENLAEAERLARNELRRLNKYEVTARLSVRGNIGLVSGVPLVLVGFGVYDGKYMIEKATHSVSGGYTTSLELRRALEGY